MPISTHGWWGDGQPAALMQPAQNLPEPSWGRWAVERRLVTCVAVVGFPAPSGCSGATAPMATAPSLAHRPSKPWPISAASDTAVGSAPLPAAQPPNGSKVSTG